MALSAKQQQQYNQLISAGASPNAAMQAAMLVPDTTPTVGAATYSGVTGAGQGSVIPSAPSTQPADVADGTKSQTAPTTPSGYGQNNYSNVALPDGRLITYAPDGTVVSITEQAGPAAIQASGQATAQAASTAGVTNISAPSSNLPSSQDYQQVGPPAQTPTQPAAQAAIPTAPPYTFSGSANDLINSLDPNSKAQLASQLGIPNYTGTPTQNQQLAQKYQAVFQATQGSGVPQSASEARTALQAQVPSSQYTDPVFGAMAQATSPIMSALSQVLGEINNPAITSMSLQSEYNQLAAANNLPQLQSQLLNYQNIMNGTEDDIRDELTKAGGGGTESQVLAMTAARNKVILKQYNALSSQYTAAQTNVQNMMQYAASDQQTELQRQQMTASVVENMASIEAQMTQMGMTMQQHTTDNLNKIVTNVGYQGLAAQAQGNPQMLSSYEQLLGLSPGSLSNPQSLQNLETLRQQTVALGQQKVNIQMYNAGLGGAPTGTNTNTPGLYVNNPGGASGQSLVATNTVGNDSQGRPYSVDASQAQNLLKNGATIDPGTNNIVVPGVGYYIAQPNGSYALSIDPTSTEGQYIQYSNRAQNPAPWQPSGSLSNQRMTRNAMTRQANAAITNYVNSPTYKNVAAAATYFIKLNAGLQNPGSIGDPEIIDSLVKINTGGQGAITEQQYSAYAQGQTWADRFQVQQGKVVAKGGTLSPQQRQDIQSLAQDTITGYMNQYQTLYTQALKNMDNQGIPDAFWGNMPDWSGILQGQLYQPLTEQ